VPRLFPGTLRRMAVLEGEGRVQILYGRYLLPAAPHRPVYMSRPDVVGRHPSTVVLHDDVGVTPSVRDLCRRLARHGYVTVAPDLFRGSDPGDLSKVPAERGVGDGIEVADALTHSWDGFTAPTRPAIVALGTSVAVGAGVASRVGGPLVVVGGPVSASVEAITSVRGPMLGLLAGAAEAPQAVRAMHAEVGRGVWVVYPSAGRRFFDDGSDDFDHESFTDALQRLVAFLDRHLAVVHA
jgi:carboxymethylenebutenolidase